VNDSFTGNTAICSGVLTAAATFSGTLQYPVKMRALPTFAASSQSAFTIAAATSLTVSAISASEPGTLTTRIAATAGGGGTGGQGAVLRFSGSAFAVWIDFTAEL